MTTAFNKDVEVKNEDYIVVLTFAGEGIYGDYDEDDPEDCPLIRADVYDINNDTECIASTCTGESANISLEEAEKYAGSILDQISKSKYNVETALSFAV